jgi:3-methyladenine DNA glycosylase Mpg
MNYSPTGLGPQDPGVIDLSTPLTCAGDLRRGGPRGTWSPQAGTIHAVSAEELAVDPLTAAQRLLGAILWSGPVGARTEADLAKGPGNLGSALGIGLADYGTDVFDPESPIRLELGRRIDPARISAGPRVGVSSEADRPWRVWLPDSPAVSTYRRSPRAPRLDESA